VLRNGQIVTIAGNGVQGRNGNNRPATDVQLDTPYSVVVSSSNQVYISEFHRIRKIDQNGIISTFAGTGEKGFNGDNQLAIHAKVNFPRGLFVTEDEELLFADCFNHRVRRVDQHGMITTIAGNGKKDNSGEYHAQLATSVSVRLPNSVFQYKNEIYISDDENRIRKIDRNGILTTIAGNGKELPHAGYRTFDENGISATEALIDEPRSVFVHKDEIYFSDSYHFQIRKIDRNGIITKVAGTGICAGPSSLKDGTVALNSPLNCVYGIYIDPEDSQIYMAESSNYCIRKIDQNGILSTVVGTGKCGYSGDVLFDLKK